MTRSENKKSVETYWSPQANEQKGSAEQFFENLIWLTSSEAAFYLRKTVGALRTMVCRGQIRARKFHGRLYFKRDELDRLLETSYKKGGFNGYF